jgi:DNA-binding transcriptional LysR family regulator
MPATLSDYGPCVAERGTLTAAAATLGYTQSAVSRQIAALEHAAGTPCWSAATTGYA